MKHLSTALTLVSAILTFQAFCATVQDPLKLIKSLQMLSVNAQTYPIVEARLKTLQEYVRIHGAMDIDKKLKKQGGWTRNFIKEIENDLQRVKPSAKREEKEQTEPLTLQDQDVQDLLSTQKAIKTLMDQPLTEESRKEIAGLLTFFENATSRLEKRNKLEEATAFLDFEPGNTVENYIKNIRNTLEPKSLLKQLQALDQKFSKIILHTTNDKITGELLVAAKRALDDFKKLRAQLTEQERKEVQKKILGDLPIDFYIKGMENAYATRLKNIPDAISQALEELNKEESEIKISQEEEKVSKEELARTHTEKATPKRETAVFGEFRLSYKEKPTKFINYPKFGRAFLFEVPTIAFYSDPYVPLERAALIEYNWNNSMRKTIPQALAKALPEHMSPAPAVYAIIWLNFEPRAHYNLVAHPVITAWRHPDILTKNPSELITKEGVITAEGQKYLFFTEKATMGLFPVSGIITGNATIPMNTLGVVDVNPHEEIAHKKDAVILFSPNNAYFFMEPKTSTASFWTYLAWGNNRIIMYNIVINTFNTGLKEISAGQIENLIIDSKTLTLEQLIKKLSNAETIFKKDDAIHQELSVLKTLAELQ